MPGRICAPNERQASASRLRQRFSKNKIAVASDSVTAQLGNLFCQLSMPSLSRLLTPFCLSLVCFFPAGFAAAQNLPNTTRLLRFPTTNGQQIVFCPGDVSVLSEAAESVRFVLDHCDHLIMNRNEAAALHPGRSGEEIAALLRARGISGAITAGEEGALLFDAHHTLRVGPGSLVAALPGFRHGFRNPGPGRARFLNIHAPSDGFIERVRRHAARRD